MFKEHMTVYAKEKIKDKIEIGCLGVIVHIYNPYLFEVEFFDKEMNTIDVVTISSKQIIEATRNSEQ
jgi:hypothetical protein